MFIKEQNYESEILAPFGTVAGQFIYDDAKVPLNYLEIPLYAKYEFRGSSSGFHLLAGPVFSVGLNGKIKYTFRDADGKTKPAGSQDSYNQILQSIGVNTQSNIEFGSSDSDDYTNTDFGVGLGVGMYIEAGSGEN